MDIKNFLNNKGIYIDVEIISSDGRKYLLSDLLIDYAKELELQKTDVISYSIPYPKEVDAWLLDKMKHKRIDDEFGWTGEYSLCQKDLIDFLIDVQNGI